jgi:shikimate dehydrogenase
VDGAYVPMAVAPADFIEVVRGLAKAGFAGVNVTIPHKEAALALCDSVEPFAARVGAVNTLVFRDGAIHGRNTDGYGFIANLRAHGVRFGGRALILGAGGAARAIGAALQDEGVDVFFCNRTAERGVALAVALNAGTVAWDERAALEGVSLLVNTTSLGMTGKGALEISLERAEAELVVADIVYAPLETALLAAARARGLHAVEGLGMLLHQAVPGFEAWFGVRPQVDAALYEVVAG